MGNGGKQGVFLMQMPISLALYKWYNHHAIRFRSSDGFRVGTEIFLELLFLRGRMKITEEFNVKNASGKVVTLQNLAAGMSYLDYGMTKLPRNFQGYRVKDTDRTAEKQSDETFKLLDSDDVYSRA